MSLWRKKLIQIYNLQSFFQRGKQISGIIQLSLIFFRYYSVIIDLSHMWFLSNFILLMYPFNLPTLPPSPLSPSLISLKLLLFFFPNTDYIPVFCILSIVPFFRVRQPGVFASRGAILHQQKIIRYMRKEKSRQKYNAKNSCSTNSQTQNISASVMVLVKTKVICNSLHWITGSFYS